MRTPKPLSVKSLYRACDLRQFDFTSTDELEEISAVNGQNRAMEALSFGLDIRQRGFNVFALGLPGVGKFTAVEELLQQVAAARDGAPDWCYLHNFEQPKRPTAVSVRGKRIPDIGNTRASRCF